VVHRIRGRIDPKSLQKALTESLSTPWPGGRPEKPEAAQSAGESKGDAKPAGDGGKQKSD
jgi:hypothetical protein